MIWIRADGNSDIGTGHLMRCLAVARQLQKFGAQVRFLVAGKEAGAFLQKRGQSFHVLHSDYRRMEEELPLLNPLLERERPALVLIDSYFVTKDYLKTLGRYAKTAYIDDRCLFSYPVDMVINYNIYASTKEYAETGSGVQPAFLMGPLYAPLREEFRGVDYEVRKEPEHVLITTGGSDKYNLSGRILQEALGQERINRLHYHVISGAFNENLPYLEELCENRENVHIHRDVTRMAGLMKECDIAVTAGGSTMYELCAVGLPIICFSFVDNQERIVETFARQGLVCYGGNYLKEKEKLIINVLQWLEKLAWDSKARKVFCERERKLVDGLGAERIAEALLRLKKEGSL